MGLERLGHHCVGFCEIDKFARAIVIKPYIIQKERLNFMILQKSEMKSGDNSEEKLISFVEDSPAKPSLLQENKGRTFRTILSTLDELGYDAEWQVLNSKDFGVPQNRERVFIIGHLRGRSERTIFPIRGESPTVDSCKPKRLGNINLSGRGKNGDVYRIDTPSPTVTTNKGEGSKIAIPVLTPDRAKKRQRC